MKNQKSKAVLILHGDYVILNGIDSNNILKAFVIDSKVQNEVIQYCIQNNIEIKNKDSFIWLQSRNDI